MTSNIKIKHRETVEYAMNQPTMIKVSIADGKVLEDNRKEFFGFNYYFYKERDIAKGRVW